MHWNKRETQQACTLLQNIFWIVWNFFMHICFGFNLENIVLKHNSHNLCYVFAIWQFYNLYNWIVHTTYLRCFWVSQSSVQQKLWDIARTSDGSNTYLKSGFRVADEIYPRNWLSTNWTKNLFNFSHIWWFFKVEQVIRLHFE